MVQFEEDNPDDLLGNMVVLGLSLVVIAAVVVGVVAGLDHSDTPVEAERSTHGAPIYDPTDHYNESCLAGREPAANNAQVMTYFKNGTACIALIQPIRDKY
jgi:hypothetical protein